MAESGGGRVREAPGGVARKRGMVVRGPENGWQWSKGDDFTVDGINGCQFFRRAKGGGGGFVGGVGRGGGGSLVKSVGRGEIVKN